MNSRILTIILNWRTPEMTLRATEAAITAMEGLEGAITIVDNNSGDGSEEVLRLAVKQRGWDRVRVIQSGHNGGFGAGNNVGIRAAMPDGSRPTYVYLLNSDAFPAPDAIRILRDHLDAHPKVGFAGSYIHGIDGEPHITCFRFPTIWSELETAAKTGPITRLLRNYIVPQQIPKIASRMDWVAGASLMIRQATLEEIGLFDEAFFLYYEETDLCLRGRCAGWCTDYVPASRVAHIGSASTGMGKWKRIPRYWFDSRSRYFRKNHGSVAAAAATLARVTGGLIWRMRRFGRHTDEPDHFLRDLIVHSLRRRAGNH